jgi:putative polyhydroxyalkanoate system protein
MAEISMRRAHPFGEQDVRKRIEELADKVCQRIGGKWAWQGDEVVCEARGATARVGFDATTIHIDVWLPRMMKPLRGRLEAKIEEYFERIIAKG